MNRLFRSIIYKKKLRLLMNKSVKFKLISLKEKYIEKKCIDASRIVISRQFQRRRKMSKHQRFKFTIKITQKKKKKKFFLHFIKRIKSQSKVQYKLKLSRIKLTNLNKKRMKFKHIYSIPYTKKGVRSRMGKGKGAINLYLCNIYLNMILYNLYRLSYLKKNILERKLRLKLGGLHPKIY
jgi:ribosomal protein L16/L10AE